jgi:NTE family protein
MFFQSFIQRPVAIIGLAASLASCGKSPDLAPIALPLAGKAPAHREIPYTSTYVETAISVSFSGGGTRASAFSFGVLSEMARIEIKPGTKPVGLLEAVDFVSGVSGGAVTAGYFGLKGRAGLADFQQKFLLRDAEEDIDTDLGLGNILTAYKDGGVNDRKGLAGWLDRNLYGGATFQQLKGRRPLTWISATDLYTRTPFVFDYETFAAMCSDLSQLRLSDAVATSAAVPVVFAPVNVSLPGNTCGYRLPGWADAALSDRRAAANLRANAAALRHMSQAKPPQYVKLVDGGLTDNFGIQPLAIARYAGREPYAPLSPEAATKLTRGLFLTVNSGRGLTGTWDKKLEHPAGLDVVMALSDVAIESTSRNGMDYFTFIIRGWEQSLVRWRCGLSPSEVTKLRGSVEGWDCRNLKFFIGQVSFDDVGGADAVRLGDIPTRFKLPKNDVHFLVKSGAVALRNNPTFRAFLSSMPPARGTTATPQKHASAGQTP